MDHSILIQARLSSRRLPGKILFKLGNSRFNSLTLMIKRLRILENSIDINLITSEEKCDDAILFTAKDSGIKCLRGSENNVLKRYYDCAKFLNTKTIIRLTSDCPFIDPCEIKRVLDIHLKNENDYTTNTFDGSSIIDGFDDYGDPVERNRILSDRFPNPYDSKEAAKASNNGAYPPDLSLIVKARSGGYNYIYSLLQGYGKEIPNDVEISDTLSYNPWFPGGGIAMYQPLYEDSVEYEDGTYASVEQMSADVTAFLAWAAEPEMEERKRLGFIVMSFLIIFTLLMFFTTTRLWKDVH